MDKKYIVLILLCFLFFAKKYVFLLIKDKNREESISTVNNIYIDIYFEILKYNFLLYIWNFIFFEIIIIFFKGMEF